jgi:short-subunit dehydrogenase
MASETSEVTGRGKTALVTGASAGIGKAFAGVFAEHGFDLVLVARREERLRELAGELGNQHDITARVIPTDLADPDAPQKIYDELESGGVTVDALVNNAGYGIPEHYIDSAWADQARFMQVMATAPAHLMHLFLPGMIERDYGRIINVSSLGGLMPGMAGHTLYSGVKSFLIKTSQSLMIELRGTGVHVTAICPGFTYTEYHDVIRTRESVSKDYPEFMWMTAEEVAHQGYDAVMAGTPVYVNGRLNAFFAGLMRFVPDSLLMRRARPQIVGD